MARAAAMTPEDRRRALIEVTVPLLYQHGRAVTTRLIADAAGVAEGTIFRVFSTKDELVDAALAHAFRPGQFLAELDAGIDPDAPLRERLLQLVEVLQRRYLRTFELMRAVGMLGPPDHDSEAANRARAQVDQSLEALLAPDADAFRVPVAEVVHLIRLLTFAGSHREIADGHFLEPDEIVGYVLDGALRQQGVPT